MSSSIEYFTFYLVLHAFFLVLPTAVSAQAMGPLTRSANNPNYFARPDGTPIYLTGSHQWNNLQDEGTTFPPAPFDYTGYLNWMQSNKYNFMRLWVVGEQPYSAPWRTDAWYIDPLPYARTDGSKGNAADGKPKFDLTKFNQAYFDRLRARVIAAGQKGIYVDVMLFEGWSLNGKGKPTNPWKYHPFNAANNVNGINGDPGNTGVGNTIQTTSAPAAVLAAQQAYVRKVIDTLNDLPVLYEISNESDTSSVQWQYNMINFIKDEEAKRPKQHPVGMTAMWCPTCDTSNAPLFNSPADWVSPLWGGYNTNPPPNNGEKVIISDVDHIWPSNPAIWAWLSFTRGINPILMDYLGNTGINVGDPVFPGGVDNTYDPIRAGMTQTANYAARMDLKTAKPNGSLTTTGYMLATPGTQYLAFAPNGGSFTVNLSAGSGSSFSVEWFNISNGAIVNGDTIAGGSTQQAFTPPFSGAAVLFLNKYSKPAFPR